MSLEAAALLQNHSSLSYLQPSHERRHSITRRSSAVVLKSSWRNLRSLEVEIDGPQLPESSTLGSELPSLSGSALTSTSTSFLLVFFVGVSITSSLSSLRFPPAPFLRVVDPFSFLVAEAVGVVAAVAAPSSPRSFSDSFLSL